MGRSLRYWPSSDRWSVSSAGCTGQSTRAKPMERSQIPKVLRLVPDSMFVSLPPSIFYISVICLFFLSSLFLHSLKRLKCVLTTQSWCALRAHYTWGLFIQRLNIITFRALCPLHMCYFSKCTFSSPLYASIWLKFWPSWVVWLLCLCPTFSLIRLGHKGSTCAIVTAGSAGCVPQTRRSRKLAFLREYPVGELKMFLHSLLVNPQKLYILRFFNHSSDMHVNACTPRERNP